MLTTFDESALIRGTVYGVAMHAGASFDVADQAVTKALPAHPVLFIKPANTFLPSGGTVLLPTSMPEVEACPVLAIVFGRDTRAVSAAEAFDGVAGYTLAIDLTEVGTGIFRPPIREKCRDGFLPLGPHIVAREDIDSLDALRISLETDDNEAISFLVDGTYQLISQLIEEVTKFMTFRAGDVLLAARAPVPARVSLGSRIAVFSEGIGRLECVVGREEEVVA